MNQNLPMHLGVSIIYFFIPAILMASSFYYLMPYLRSNGFNDYYAYAISLGMPLLIMLIASIIAFIIEGNSMDIYTFVERFRLKPLSLKDILLAAVIFVIEIGTFYLIAQFSEVLISKGVIKIPSLPPVADPKSGLDSIAEAVGGLRGNWQVFVVTAILLVINVVGEEFWWRGYILPRARISVWSMGDFNTWSYVDFISCL